MFALTVCPSIEGLPLTQVNNNTSNFIGQLIDADGSDQRRDVNDSELYVAVGGDF